MNSTDKQTSILLAIRELLPFGYLKDKNEIAEVNIRYYLLLVENI